jgi:hypothetical protein
VHVTLDDLAAYLQAHLAGERGVGGILTTDSFRTLHTVVASDYALGWSVAANSPGLNATVVGHNGSNLRWLSAMWVCPVTGCRGDGGDEWRRRSRRGRADFAQPGSAGQDSRNTVRTPVSAPRRLTRLGIHRLLDEIATQDAQREDFLLESRAELRMPSRRSIGSGRSPAAERVLQQAAEASKVRVRSGGSTETPSASPISASAAPLASSVRSRIPLRFELTDARRSACPRWRRSSR